MGLLESVGIAFKRLLYEVVAGTCGVLCMGARWVGLVSGWGRWSE